jgi:antitoxin component of RelBE/YafQ-DinJ toxin-antitoxin module
MVEFIRTLKEAARHGDIPFAKFLLETNWTTIDEMDDVLKLTPIHEAVFGNQGLCHFISFNY